MHLPPLAQATLGVLTILLATGLGVTGYLLANRSTALHDARSELASTTAANTLATERLQSELNEATAQSQELNSALGLARSQKDSLERKVGTLATEVGALAKIVETDPQLLAKYSKVYFLNENYVPRSVATIPSEFTFDRSRTYLLEEQSLPFLNRMIASAAQDDIDLLVVSAYRSFGEQSALKASYRITYGSGANRFSAEQGYSEHQLGTTIDFTTPALGAGFTSFDTTPAFAWLLENAHEFGFILSYPKGNSFYVYEPWHWRFVGVELATDIHKNGQHFYDLDQRAINEYLGTLFDR